MNSTDVQNSTSPAIVGNNVLAAVNPLFDIGGDSVLFSTIAKDVDIHSIFNWEILPYFYFNFYVAIFSVFSHVIKHFNC